MPLPVHNVRIIKEHVDVADKWELVKGPQAFDGWCHSLCPIDLSEYVVRSILCLKGQLNYKPWPFENRFQIVCLKRLNHEKLTTLKKSTAIAARLKWCRSRPVHSWLGSLGTSMPSEAWPVTLAGSNVTSAAWLSMWSTGRCGAVCFQLVNKAFYGNIENCNMLACFNREACQ